MYNLLVLGIIKILLIIWRERIIGGMKTNILLILQILDARRLYGTLYPCDAADSREFFDAINLRTL